MTVAVSELKSIGNGTIMQADASIRQQQLLHSKRLLSPATRATIRESAQVATRGRSLFVLDHRRDFWQHHIRLPGTLRELLPEREPIREREVTRPTTIASPDRLAGELTSRRPPHRSPVTRHLHLSVALQDVYAATTYFMLSLDKCCGALPESRNTDALGAVAQTKRG